MSKIENAEYLENVREQYESYPYPYRKAEEEKERLMDSVLHALNKVNYFCYEGKENFQNFRVLDVGCGTGDGVMYLAEQLREFDAEVVALDMTEASLDIAKTRAETRNLKNITWIHNSLLELPNLDIGKFDFISCSGVLHHLSDPELGLKALKSVLKPTGAIGIMVYAAIGRTAIYQIQELMRNLNTDEKDLNKQVENTKSILKVLPQHNWFKFSENLFSDIDQMGDIGIYDLLLHPQDRAYTIPQLYEFIESAGLEFSEMSAWHDRFCLDPLSYITEPELQVKIVQMSRKEQLSIGELLFGALIKHTVFITPEPRSRPSYKDLDNIPYLANFNETDTHLILSQALHSSSEEEILISRANNFTIPKTKYSPIFLKYMDGKNSTKEICQRIKTELKDPNLSDSEVTEDFHKVFKKLNSVDHLLLRAPGSATVKGKFLLQADLISSLK